MTDHRHLRPATGTLDGPPHELFAELRRTQPVFWQDMPDEPGYWAVLKHADVVHVAKEPTLFSASEGGVVLENLTPEALEGDADDAARDGPAPARRPTAGRSRRASRRA